MRNGTGKTTSLKLMQRLFAGMEISLGNGGEEAWIMKRCKYKGLRAGSNPEIKESERGASRFSVTLDVNDVELIDATGKDIELEVDGGINFETSQLAINAGADVLVAGTSTFQGGQDNYANNISKLRSRS